MNNYNMPYIPSNLPYNQFSNNSQQLIRVNGIEGAKAYQMSANSTAALFDSSEDIMYIKTTDGAGFGSIRKFSFVEIQDATQPTGYVSREEYEQFKREVMDIGKQFIQFTKQPADESGADNESK